MAAPALRGYYAILDWKGSTPPASAGLHSRASALLASGPCCLQLRAKGLTARALRQAAGDLLSLCRRFRVPLCVNDRVDVALAVGADAVHLGQDDLSVKDARRVAGDALFIGVSTHDPAQAHAAFEAGADYVGFGPVFPTGTKERPDPVVGEQSLARVAQALSIPVVAIGGIDLANVHTVAATGAAAAAVISAVEGAVDPTVAGRRIGEVFRLAGNGRMGMEAS